jgi:hypothetical protein
MRTRLLLATISLLVLIAALAIPNQTAAQGRADSAQQALP